MTISEKFWSNVSSCLAASTRRAVTTLFNTLAIMMLMTSSAFAGDCGIASEVIPEFTLVDVNPTSASYDQLVSRDQLLGDVIVMYWAHAT